SVLKGVDPSKAKKLATRYLLGAITASQLARIFDDRHGQLRSQPVFQISMHERRNVSEYEKWPRLVRHQNGTFYAFYKDESGQMHRVSLKTQNFNLASSKYNRLLENVAKGVLGFDPNPKAFLCSQAIDKYLETGIADLAPSTLKRYNEAIENHLKPYFGKMSL